MASPRSLMYAAGAALCLGVAVASLLHRSSRPSAPATSPTAKAPVKARAPGLDPAAISAPAASVPSPDSRKTAQAMQGILDRDPVIRAQRRALDEKAAQGDAIVPKLLEGCLAKPHDQALVVDAVVVLRRINTPESRQALARIQQACPVAAQATAALDESERR